MATLLPRRYFSQGASVARLLLGGVARVVVIGDSKAEKSRQSNLTSIFESFPLNYASVYVTSRNTSSFIALGQGSTYTAAAGATRTDRDIGASFAETNLATNSVPINAAEINFASNVAAPQNIFNSFVDFNSGWTADNPPTIKWGAGQWTRRLITARGVYLQHPDAPTVVALRYGRSNSGGTAWAGGGTSSNFSMAGTLGVAYQEAPITAAGSYTAADWPAVGYNVGISSNEAGKTMVALGVVFKQTLTTTQQMRVVQTGQSGMKTVEFLNPDGTEAATISAVTGTNPALTNATRFAEFLSATLDGPPNVVVIQLGANRYTGVNASIDEYSGGVYTAKHTDYLVDIANYAKAVVAAMGGATPYIVFVTDFAVAADDTAAESRRTRTFAAAQAIGAAVLDTYRFIKDSMGSAEFAAYYDDSGGLHLNAGGQEVLGRMIFAILQDTASGGSGGSSYGNGSARIRWLPTEK